MGKQVSKLMKKSENKRRIKELLQRLEKYTNEIAGEVEKFDIAASEQTDEEVQRKLKLQNLVKEMQNEFTNYQKHNNNRGKSEDRIKKKTKQIPATIQIYFPQERQLSNEVNEWQDILRRKLDTEIKFKPVKDTSNINQEMLLIIVCTAQERLQADATDALRDIKSKENVVILFIHLTEVDDVTNENSSLVWSGDEIFNNLQGIFDITIKRDYGIIPNAMNDRNIDDLCSIIKSSIDGYSTM